MSEKTRIEDVFGVSRDELIASGWGPCELCGEEILNAGEFLWICRGQQQMLCHRDCGQQVLTDPVPDGTTVVHV